MYLQQLTSPNAYVAWMSNTPSSDIWIVYLTRVYFITLQNVRNIHIYMIIVTYDVIIVGNMNKLNLLHLLHKSLIPFFLSFLLQFPKRDLSFPYSFSKKDTYHTVITLS